MRGRRRVVAWCGWLAASLLAASVAAPARAQLLVSDSGVGYIDPAVPANLVRLRFDAAYDADFPDRAEFFYGAWGSSGPGAPGPPLRERSADFQELTAYVEVAPATDFSAFAETPVRFLNPAINDNSAGFGDLNLGVKWALLQTDWSLLTLQLRLYLPTGDADRGMGTNHVSCEPALLGLCRVTERWVVEGELRDWIPIDGTDGFAGNVLRYGVGLSYLFNEIPDLTVRPVVEFVGWSVLDGQKSNLAGVFDAAGDTIVNGKFGVRVGVGPGDVLTGQRHSFYAGYGRALTHEVWYEEIARVEYRLTY